MRVLWTIGYERLMPEALVGELKAAGVQRVVDVRRRPQSRRPGMSKTKLGQRFGEAEIAYLPWQALGTPEAYRTLYRRGANRAAAEGYRAHLEADAVHELERLRAMLADGVPTALLCLEAEPGGCHRRVIAKALTAREPGLRVVDL